METPVFRDAEEADLPAILALLADDDLGEARERAGGPPDAAYFAAFRAIAADPHCRLIVVEVAGEIVGTFQLNFLASLSRRGAYRGQIEAVRVDRARRGGGLGTRMMLWAVETCRARGCSLVQLTSDKARPEAHRFYARLDFVASHEGFKRLL